MRMRMQCAMFHMQRNFFSLSLPSKFGRKMTRVNKRNITINCGLSKKITLPHSSTHHLGRGLFANDVIFYKKDKKGGLSKLLHTILYHNKILKNCTKKYGFSNCKWFFAHKDIILAHFTLSVCIKIKTL